MKSNLLGTGCYEYTDEYEPVVVCCTAENLEVRDGMENNAYSLEELVLEMDAVGAGSEQGVEQEKVAWALQVKVEEQGPQQGNLKEVMLMLQVEKVEEQGVEQEALKEAAPTLQVEKVEDHLRVLEYHSICS